MASSEKEISKPQKESLNKKLKRDVTKYVVVLAVDLFSRYAFAKAYRIYPSDHKPQKKEASVSDLVENTEVPKEEVAAAAYEEQVEDEGFATKLGADKVLEAVKGFYKQIEDLGYDPPRFFITDTDNQFGITRRDDSYEVIPTAPLNVFLTEHKTVHGISVANDRIHNPPVESFIKTFRLFFGRALALLGKNELDQTELDGVVRDVMSFYNNRQHSRTQMAPAEVLKNEQDREVLYDHYLRLSLTQSGLLVDSSDIKKGDVVRIYTKWLPSDKNPAELKANLPNWSATLFRVVDDPVKNFYPLKPLTTWDARDKLVKRFPKQGLRREYLLPVNYDNYVKYNLGT